MPKTVLVVDDSAPARRHLSGLLKRAGYDVVEAAHGMAALERLSASQTFDLLIVDINMPGMTGVDLLEERAARRLASAAQAMVLSTERHPDLVRRAKAAGARAWILKPYKSELILQAVKDLTGEM